MVQSVEAQGQGTEVYSLPIRSCIHRVSHDKSKPTFGGVAPWPTWHGVNKQFRAPCRSIGLTLGTSLGASIPSMLAVFGKPKQEVLNSPLSPSKRKLNETPEDETFVASLLDNLYSSLPRRQRALVNEETWGGAGLGYVESERHQFATDGDVSVFFAGELVNSPSDLEDADFLLAEYKRTWDHASLLDSSPVMEALAQLEGPFAFVIYDRTYGRIIAARDGQGAEPLVWGTTMLSDGLLFASDRSLIEGECADVDDFPAGTIFVSNDWSTAGNLSPIRPDGSEPVTKELCRVESRSNIKGSLTKVASGTDIQAN